jgi:hypothetical protein
MEKYGDTIIYPFKIKDAFRTRTGYSLKQHDE